MGKADLRKYFFSFISQVFPDDVTFTCIFIKHPNLLYGKWESLENALITCM